MKTPREILLQRHQNAVPKLDRIRAGLRQPSTRPKPPLFSAAFYQLWNELILPARGTWGGLAAVWMVLLVIHFGTAPKHHDTSALVSSEQMAAAMEQHRLLAELLEPPQTKPPEPPPKRVPHAFFARSLHSLIS